MAKIASLKMFERKRGWRKVLSEKQAEFRDPNLTPADGHEAGRGLDGLTPNEYHYPINKK